MTRIHILDEVVYFSLCTYVSEKGMNLITSTPSMVYFDNDMQPLLEKENTEFKPVLHAYEIISVTSFSTWTGCILVQNKIKICKGCNPEDLPKAMNDRETWRERVRDIRASRTSWWWWWLYVHISCEKRINDALLINSTLNFLGIPYGVTTIIVENGGARGVVVIVVGNGHGDTSSNPGRDWLHFT